MILNLMIIIHGIKTKPTQKNRIINGYFIGQTVENNKIITLILKYYPRIKKDLHFQKFQQMFNINNILKIDELTQDVFNMSYKFLCINTGMGSGKTFQTIKYLKDKNNYIWVTPNIALAQNTTQRLRTDGIDI